VSNPVQRPSAAVPVRFTFRKAERLCSRRLLDGLFKSGNAFNTYPLRFVVWRTGAGTLVCGNPEAKPAFRPRSGAPVQVVLSVSKRHFKRAHDRNRLKRQLREAWRHHKPWLLEQPGVRADAHSVSRSPLLIAVLYIGREKPETLTYLRKRLRKGLERLLTELPGNVLPSAS
jgi:ribonuclease P protein component